MKNPARVKVWIFSMSGCCNLNPQSNCDVSSYVCSHRPNVYSVNPTSCPKPSHQSDAGSTTCPVNLDQQNHPRSASPSADASLCTPSSNPSFQPFHANSVWQLLPGITACTHVQSGHVNTTLQQPTGIATCPHVWSNPWSATVPAISPWSVANSQSWSLRSTNQQPAGIATCSFLPAKQPQFPHAK